MDKQKYRQMLKKLKGKIKKKFDMDDVRLKVLKKRLK